jgi:hypothetical protein
MWLANLSGNKSLDVIGATTQSGAEDSPKCLRLKAKSKLDKPNYQYEVRLR